MINKSMNISFIIGLVLIFVAPSFGRNVGDI